MTKMHTLSLALIVCLASSVHINAFENVALNKRATQSTQVANYAASNALTSGGNCVSNGFSHTENEWEPWLQIDLGSLHEVQSVSVRPRVDWDTDLKVYLQYNSAETKCDATKFIVGGETGEFYCGVNVQARYVIVKRDNRNIQTAMCLCEIQVTGRRTECSGNPHVSPGIGVKVQSSLPSTGRAYFSCSPGYKLEGASYATCTSSGQWQMSGSQPSCKQITCPPPHAPANGKLSPNAASWTVGMTVTYSCDENFKLEGTRTDTCDDYGRWRGNGAVPTCTPIECPRLSLTDNIRLQGTGRRIGSMRVFTCTQGYEVGGPNSITCELRDGQGRWSGSVPNCHKKNCRTPQVPDNGQVLGSDYSYGAVVKYMCNPGYTLEGAESSTCHEEGWGGQTPVCKVVSCRDPGVSPHSIREGSSIAHGAVVSYSCEPGYDLKGPKDIVCELTGTWSARRPICEPITCPNIMAPRYGSKDGDVFEYGENVEFSCFPGYKLVGSSVSVCQDDRTWSKPVPTCTACPVGTYKDTSNVVACTSCPTNSTTITSASTSRQHCSCEPGTTGPLGGPCTVVVCDQLVAPEDGEILISSQCGTYIHSECEFSCDDGHIILGGNRRRKCTANGWSGNPVSCKACPSNTYTVIRGSESCTPCPRRTQTEQGKLGLSIASCVCAPGYRGLPGGPCLDINECSDKSTCDQDCVNTQGSYFCRCKIPGYVLDTDGKTCLLNQTCETLKQQPNHGKMNCQYHADTNGHNCDIKCRPGYFFVSGINDYVTCGHDSDFKWSHRLLNSSARLPACTREFFVDVDLPIEIVYLFNDACIDNPMNTRKAHDILDKAVNTIEICENKCVVNDVTIECDDNGSNSSRIIVRFDVLFTNVRPNQVPENCTTGCKLDNIRAVLTNTVGMKNELKKLVETQPDMFQMDEDNAPTLDSGSFKFGRPSLLCEKGKVFTNMRLCVPCDRGYYLPKRDFKTCEPCPVGMYQDQQGQTLCKKCLDGSSTLAVGADHPIMCSQKVASVRSGTS